MPKPLPKTVPQYCVECKTSAVWAKSKSCLCWWCEGKPAINKGLECSVKQTLSKT